MTYIVTLVTTQWLLIGKKNCTVEVGVPASYWPGSRHRGGKYLLLALLSRLMRSGRAGALTPPPDLRRQSKAVPQGIRLRENIEAAKAK
jgi:hypothetical protein